MNRIVSILGMAMALTTCIHSANADQKVVKCKIEAGEIRLKIVAIPLIYTYPHPIVGFWENFQSGELTCNHNSIMDFKDDEILNRIDGLACVGAREFAKTPEPVTITFQQACGVTFAALTYADGKTIPSEGCVVETFPDYR